MPAVLSLIHLLTITIEQIHVIVFVFLYLGHKQISSGLQLGETRTQLYTLFRIASTQTSRGVRSSRRLCLGLRKVKTTPSSGARAI